VLSLDQPDALAHAHAANRFGGDAYIGLEAGVGSRSIVHYYRVPAFESAGGRSLATRVTAALAAAGVDLDAPCGMRLPILRETRMPAVLCRLAPIRDTVDAASSLADALASAVRDWAEHPLLTVR
jgi:N-acetylmuramoyl-L-alanine amidase